VNYAVGTLTPTYNNVFEKWLSLVMAFQPPPKEIVVATENRAFPEKPQYTRVLFDTFNPHYINPTSYGGKLLRIGDGREAVRRYVCSKDHEWLLFIDSDIYAPPETPRLMFEAHQKTNVLCVQNLVRDSGAVYFGCILIHRDILRAVHFFSLAYADEGWISEDWVFFNILKWYNFFQPNRFPWVRDAVVPITHYHGPNDIRQPLPINTGRPKVTTQ